MYAGPDLKYHDESMGLFLTSVSEHRSYPTNLAYVQSYKYQLDEYKQQLDNHSDELFGGQNLVDVLERHHGVRDIVAKRIKNMYDLKNIGMCSELCHEDPISRFVFISALSSRDKLNIQHNLLVWILTWHQVMPEFVDLLLAFGSSERAKDFHFSGFRSEMNLNEQFDRLELRSLGRSGRELKLCHILRSVERVETKGESDQRWPWTLRPAATYHSFDVETGRTMWIIIKANGLIKKRIKATCKDQDLYQSSNDRDLDQLFESTLRTHLVICAWAGENWRWYINFIEEQVQNLTRDTLTETVDRSTLEKQLASRTPSMVWPTQSDYTPSEKPSQTQEPRISFGNLQEVHYVEEKANECLLVLRANSAVIGELRSFYSEVTSAMNAGPGFVKTSDVALTMFHRQLDVIAKDLDMQLARLQMLLHLLSNRRTLLESTLQWKNAELNVILAEKARDSANNMEALTKAMHTISHETKMEAANMRIITLVTLFFLPGTFVSTLMSTPIVHYPENREYRRNINFDALYLFLAISLPLLVLTVTVWLGLYWQKKRATRIEDCLSKFSHADYPP